MGNIKESSGEKMFEAVIIFMLLLFSTIVIYPILLLVSGSFSDPVAVMANRVVLWPVDPTLQIYKLVLKNPQVWVGYKNTIIYTLIGTVINLSLTALAAYPLSRSDFYGKKIFLAMFLFTMFFHGGMIPNYLLVKQMGLFNSMWALLLPTAISTWNLIIMRTFFQNSIPVELQEAAFVDGATDFGIFFKVILPLSMPVMAVMTLFYGVGHWNSWFSALLYLSKRSYYPLQLILREVLIQSTNDEAANFQEGIKYAIMVIATLPILCLYPVLQKYFVKGVMVGAVKG